MNDSKSAAMEALKKWDGGRAARGKDSGEGRTYEDEKGYVLTPFQGFLVCSCAQIVQS